MMSVQWGRREGRGGQSGSPEPQRSHTEVGMFQVRKQAAVRMSANLHSHELGLDFILRKAMSISWKLPLKPSAERFFKVYLPWGTWVAQLVKQLTSAQVMISWSVSSSPTSGSVLTAQSLEPVSDSVSPSL